MSDTFDESLDAAERALRQTLRCRAPTVHDSVEHALTALGDARRALGRWLGGPPDTRCTYCEAEMTASHSDYTAWACGRKYIEDEEERTVTCYKGEIRKLRRELDGARREEARDD